MARQGALLPLSREHHDTLVTAHIRFEERHVFPLLQPLLLPESAPPT